MTDRRPARLITILLLVLGLFAGNAQAVPFTGLVVFGDSLADGGNNALVFDSLRPDLPPGTLRTDTPIERANTVPAEPYRSNRYSNGPVWVEQLAQGLGLAAPLPSMLGGSNFAFGGARTGPSGSNFPFSLLDQVSMFMAASGGTAPAGALYVIQGGGNDGRDVIRLALEGGDPDSIIAEIAAFAANVGQIVGDLLDAGARDFLIANVPDLGTTPLVRDLGGEAAQVATSIADQMNAALDLTLAQLMLPSAADLRVFDLFDLTGRLFADPTAFGMTDMTTVCASDPVCIADPSTTFFWDGLHPTTAGHAVIAGFALAQVVPLPATLILLVVGAIALSATRARQSQRRTRLV